MELRSAENMFDLIEQAMTYQSGKNNGEYLMKCNPEYKAQVKAASKKMEIK